MSGEPPGDAAGLDAFGLETTSSGSAQAAIARTASRSLALYFARPVRLFRPAKVNGWQTLRNLATQQGEVLSSRYLVSLIKLQGVAIIPKHFIPPMLVNAGLGTVLWTAYGETGSALEPVLAAQSISNSAASGAVAGLCQAVVAAPAENVRLLLEQGFHGHSWSCAWKEVFRDKLAISPKGAQQLSEIHQLRNWMHDVGQMAGRGWEGWGWGCAKDAVGFAAFFSIFEISRRAGVYAKIMTQSWFVQTDTAARVKTQLPAIANGVTLITGGVFAGLAYEYSCRPFEIARRIIYLERLERPDTAYRILGKRIATEGLGSLFQSDILPHVHSTGPPSKWAKVYRTIGRVGPWGIGFLVWEAYGSGGLS
ncbi:hypothetical protein CPB83DRAFT_847633 [Crepidotus variabilis]|uniref:Mitochondrial carrier n=1 Tax=Crepidotus variabilis TaxID=179855 RepID=A0A9P6ENM4_9AGAR|nr:hypothetical protein CPB83DRAFT_847633 [Crepidotus variabilis]